MFAGLDRRARLALRSGWAAALLALGLTLGAGPGTADEDAAPRPPAWTSGLPVGGGAQLWRHPGLSRPPDAAGVRWAVERSGTRRLGGRDVDVLGYAPRVDPATGGAAPRAYAQADFVDPATGEVVGGLSGWGQESFPVEDEWAPRPCPGK